MTVPPAISWTASLTVNLIPEEARWSQLASWSSFVEQPMNVAHKEWGHGFFSMEIPQIVDVFLVFWKKNDRNNWMIYSTSRFGCDQAKIGKWLARCGDSSTPKCRFNKFNIGFSRQHSEIKPYKPEISTKHEDRIKRSYILYIRMNQNPCRIRENPAFSNQHQQNVGDLPGSPTFAPPPWEFRCHRHHSPPWRGPHDSPKKTSGPDIPLVHGFISTNSMDYQLLVDEHPGLWWNPQFCFICQCSCLESPFRLRLCHEIFLGWSAHATTVPSPFKAKHHRRRGQSVIHAFQGDFSMEQGTKRILGCSNWYGGFHKWGYLQIIHFRVF